MTSERPFAVLYRRKIDPSYEDIFRERWRETTIQLREHHGALGSCLSRDEEGHFFAFARWPTEEHREMAFSRLPPVELIPGILDFHQTKLWVEDDLLLG